MGVMSIKCEYCAEMTMAHAAETFETCEQQAALNENSPEIMAGTIWFRPFGVCLFGSEGDHRILAGGDAGGYETRYEGERHGDEHQYYRPDDRQCRHVGDICEMLN